jgi:uncharacterized protein
MRPLSLAERAVDRPTVGIGALLGGSAAIEGATDVRLAEYAAEIVASGFPGIRPLSGRAQRSQLDGYIERIVERDFPDLGRTVRNEGALLRWITATAAATSTAASFEAIRDAASGGEREKPAKSTVIPYREVLERLWIVDDLPAWLPTRNRLRRLAAAPKHHLVDPALVARLLGVGADALLEGRAAGPPIVRSGSLLGALFESLVTQSVRVYAQANEARVFHLRTHGGDHDIDLIIEADDGRVVAAEVKLTAAVDDMDVKHLHWLRDQIGDDLIDAVVLTTGREAYRRQDGVAVVPAALLGP